MSHLSSIQQDFSQHIRSHKPEDSISDIEDRRLSVYRDLFFNNVEGFISGAFPVLKEIIDADDWQTLVRDFFVNHSCETPYFLEISEEFLSYLQQCKLEFLPVYSYQLAHWEWMELFADVYDEQAEPSAPLEVDVEANGEAVLNMVLTTSETAWPAAYEYPVHTISSDNKQVEPQQSFFVVYRNADLEVGFIEINPLSYVLFQGLQENQTDSTETLLTNIANAHGMDVQQVISGGSQIIQQWLAAGIVKPA